MPEPPTIQRLRGLILSASDLHIMNPEWTDAMIEDYLNILDNIITLANLLDIEIDQTIEEIPTNFTDGSIPFADDSLLIEDSGITWDNLNKILSATNALITSLTADRLISSNSDKLLVSVVDLTAWITGTDLQPVNSDGDGTVSLNDDELEFYTQAVA